MDDSVSMMRRLLEGFPFGAVVVSKNMTVSAANSRAARMLEVDLADLAPGASAAALIEKLVARGDYGERETAVNHVLTQIGTDNASFAHKTQSGVMLNVSFRAIDGERLVTIEDLTEAHAEREQLKRSAQQMRDMLDASPIAVAIVGPGGGCSIPISAMTISTAFRPTRCRRTCASFTSTRRSATAFWKSSAATAS